MQYDVTTAEEYLEVIENDWRKEKLLEVREIILSFSPSLQETIRYKMLAYDDESTGIFALNAQKNFVSLYVGSIDKIDGAEDLLKDFNLGKGCIRIRKSIHIKDTKLKEFIQKTIELTRDGVDTSC